MILSYSIGFLLNGHWTGQEEPKSLTGSSLMVRLPPRPHILRHGPLSSALSGVTDDLRSEPRRAWSPARRRGGSFSSHEERERAPSIERGLRLVDPVPPPPRVH